MYEKHVDSARPELRGKGIGPLLQKCLGARVRRQQGRGRQPTEGAHRQDKAFLLGQHVREDCLRGAQRAHAVYIDDVADFLEGRVGEGDGDAVALADVVDQDGYFFASEQGGQGAVVLVTVLGEVNRQDFHRIGIPGGFDLRG